MSKPTDADLNRAMAEALGWRQRINVQWEEDHDGFASGNDGWLEPGQSDRETEGKRVCPRFCTDRNSLPAVYAALESAEADSDFWVLLENEVIAHFPDGRQRLDWYCSTAPPVLHVRAALRALGLWKPEWTEGE